MSPKRKDGRDPDSGNTARSDDAQPEEDKTIESNTSSKSDPELLRGKLLGDKYEILSHLGSGAMGAVYKARHQILNKDVAVKVLQSADLKDRVKKERFLREAKAQGGLTHRNIAAVHDFGLTEDEQPFFVMDFLEGKTLEEYLETEKTLDFPQFITIFEQVARGLQHAHSKGIIHRDLKPSNIMLINSDEEEMHALLVDFGIAVHSEKELTKLTKAGYIVGTPHYMSPEQIEGKTLDARSDIYSLGCVMFESLTGNVPFLGSSAAATMALHLAQPPEHITSFKTKTPLPESLADLVMRCIEKRPENRIGTAKELAALLNDIKTASANNVDKEKKDDTKEEEQKKPETKSEAGENLAIAGKVHQKNPAHAPAAEESALSQIKLKPSGSSMDDTTDSGKNAGGGSNSDPDAEDSGARTQLLDESGRLRLQIEEGTVAPGVEEQSAAEKTKNSQLSIESKEPEAQSANEQAVSQPGSSSASPVILRAKEPLDWSVNGHDVIRLVTMLLTALIFWPANGRLVLPITPAEMRDDNPFFILAKVFVEIYNYVAADRIYQWVLLAAIIFVIHSIVYKLLKSGDD